MRRWLTDPTAIAILAWLATIGILAAVRARLGLGVPLGPDPALWGLAAEQIARGSAPRVAPGYPAVVALLSFGREAWIAGGWVSLVCAAAVPAVVGRIAYGLGAPFVLAVLAGVACLAHPDLLGFAWHLQPDALATITLLGVLAAGLRWEERPGPAEAALWVGSAVALALVREHGVVVLAATLAAIGARRSPRLGVALLVALLVVGFAVALRPDALPERLARPFRESPLGVGRGAPPDWVKELRGGGAAVREAWARGEAGPVWVAVWERAWTRSGANLAIIGLGLLAWASRRKGAWAALATLAPVVLVAIVWTQRRHTSVLVPVALIGLAAAQPPARWPATVVLVASLAWARAVPDTMAGLAEAAAAGHGRIALARWMKAQPGSWFLGGQHNEMNLHLRWPRNDPQLPPPGTPMPRVWSGADWRTMWVAPVGSMPPPFVPVHAEGQLAAWRLEAPEGQPRPCDAVEPVSDVLFSIGPVTGEAAPPCEGEAGFGAAPQPGAKPWTGQPWRPDDD